MGFHALMRRRRLHVSADRALRAAALRAPVTAGAVEPLERRVLFAVPAAPTGLAAAGASGTQVRLSWTDVATETSYKVQQSVNGGAYALVGTAAANKTKFLVPDLSPLNDYAFRVIATNGDGDSTPSGSVTGSTLGPLGVAKYTFDDIADETLASVPSTTLFSFDGDLAYTDWKVSGLSPALSTGTKAARVKPASGSVPGTELSLGGLPSHNKLTVRFSVYVMNKYDGPFTFYLDGKKILSTDFANSYGTSANQSYPAEGGDAFAPQDGGTTSHLDSDGLGACGGHVADSTYTFEFPIEHHASTAALTFSGDDNSATSTLKSWVGVDDVSVSVVPVEGGEGALATGANRGTVGGTKPGRLASGGFGTPISFGPAYTNTGAAALESGHGGNNMVNAELPVLTQVSDTLFAVFRGDAPVWFESDGAASPTFTARYDVKDKLAYVGGSQEYVLTAPDGTKTRFHDFSTSLSPLQRGQAKSVTEPAAVAGELTQFTYYTDVADPAYAKGKLKELVRTAVDGGVTHTEKFAVTYWDGTSTNEGLTKEVVLSRARSDVSSGAFTTVRKTEYAYYGSGESHGSLNDLKTETLKDAPGNVIDVRYRRYYKSGDANGYEGGLKSEFGPAAYERLKAAYADPTAATDVQANAYADAVYEYDAQRRVSERTVAGAGTYTYMYETSGHGSGFRYWRHKVTELAPDGTDRVLYANFAGQPVMDVERELLTQNSISSFSNVGTMATANVTGHGYTAGDTVVVRGAAAEQYNGSFLVDSVVNANSFKYVMRSDPGGASPGTSAVVNEVGRQWRTYRDYDTAGRLTLLAHPSAVSGHDDSRADLVHRTTAYLHLRDAIGLIEKREYHASGAVGYLKEVSLKRGDGATTTPIQQRTLTYTSVTAGADTAHYVASDTIYRNTNAGGQTTNLSYTYFSGTTQIQTLIATYPTVSSAQNGPGSADAETTAFDRFGRPTWFKDADGLITSVQYDHGTGAVLKTIVDVNTGAVADEPSGWTTPAGAGLHLIHTMDVDGMGRVTKLVDPKTNAGDVDGNTTYLVYNDAAHEVRAYAGWTGTTTTGPTVVTREDRAGKYTETLTMTATPGVSGSRPTGGESISAVQSLVRSHVNDAGQVVQLDEYHDLTGQSYSTSATIGSMNTNYYRTEYSYDVVGRLQRQKDAAGGITWRTYDVLGRSTGTWMGTDDTGAVTGDPDGSGGANNMLRVTTLEYDGGGSNVGNSNLTKLTHHPLGGAADRVTEMYYDWRDRLVASKSGVQAVEALTLTTQRLISYYGYDNLGQVIAAETYDGDNQTIARVQEEGGSDTDGLPNAPSPSLLRARSVDSFDEQGRVYRTLVYSVDEFTGTPGSALQSDVWYDRRGNVIKSKGPSGLVAKAQYDGAGRVTKTFATDGGGDPAPGASSNWTHADDVTGDQVLEQAEFAYDRNGNAILVTAKQRFHDETGTGELSSASVAPKARVSYSAMYYDAVGRPTAQVEVGTNGGTAYARPSSVPSRSDTVLVDSYAYDAAGRLWKATDPKGIEDRFEYDLLGRAKKAVEAYADGTPGDADDRTTLYTYDGLGNVRTLTADLPSGQNDQVTEYVYGVTTGGGSDVNASHMLAEIRYPDKSTGAAGAAASDKETFKYNALGQVKSAVDQNGTTHALTYDVLGRLLSDAATLAGGNPQGVDSAVLRLETAYDTAGRAFKFTSYNAASGGSVVNEVQHAFNGLGQLTTEYQEHAGSVNTGTSLKVQYAYDTTAASSVFTKGSRLKSVTYPNGRVLRHEYTSGLDDSIGRTSYLADDSAGTVSTHLEEYSYLGLGSIVERLRPQPGLDLTYKSSTAGDAGDQYAGLDRFGRVVDQRWIDRRDPLTLGDDVDADRFLYTYDRNSNRLSRDWASTGAPATLDEAYTYDNLGRLTKMNRGMLASGTISDANAVYTRRWDGTGGSGLDALGNWKGVTTDTNGGTSGGDTTTTRTHDSRNELTGVTGAAYSLTYDNNGSMTRDDAGQQYVYDAWNRTVKAKNAAGTELVSYKVDALGRRTYQAPTATGGGGAAKDLYYSAGWQVLEEREGGSAKYQNVWSLAYIDALVLRDTVTSVAAGGLDTTFSGDGKLVQSLTAGADVAKAILQADGKVVAVGEANGNVGLARVNADGTLDAAFDGPGGGGNGVFTVDFGGTDAGRGIAVQSDGKIVIVGLSDGDVILARFNAADGSLDTTFDGDGKVKIDFGSGSEVGADLAVQADGKIVVVGTSGGDVLVARFNADGSLDTSAYSTAATPGYEKFDLTGDDQGWQLTLDHDGKAVLGADTTNSITTGDAVAIRLNTDGTPDTSFDSDGTARLSFSSVQDAVRGVEVDDQNRIVLGGRGNGDFQVVRFTTAGALDTTFDTDGKQSIDISGADEGDALVIDGFGRILIAGGVGGNVDFGVVRLTSAGALDTTFDTDGKQTIDFAGGATVERCETIALQTSGEVVLAGSSGDDFAVARLSGGGTRTYAAQDANFNTTAITDAAGKVLERYQYDPYGSVTVLNADFTPDADNKQDVDQPFLWKGGALVTATGAYHFRNRDYSPTLGRWATHDPLGYVDGLNAYLAFLGSPTLFNDPLGLSHGDDHGFCDDDGFNYGAGVLISFTLGDRVVASSFHAGVGIGYQTDYIMPVLDVGAVLRFGNGHGNPFEGGLNITTYAALTAVAGYPDVSGAEMPIHLFDYDVISQIGNPYEYSAHFGQSLVYDSGIPQTSFVGYGGFRLDEVSAYTANDNAAFTFLSNWMTEQPATDSAYTGSAGVDICVGEECILGIFQSTYTGQAPNRAQQNENLPWTSPYYDQPDDQLSLNHTVSGVRYTGPDGSFVEFGFSGPPILQNGIHENWDELTGEGDLHLFQHDPNRYGLYGTYGGGSDRDDN